MEPLASFLLYPLQGTRPHPFGHPFGCTLGVRRPHPFGCAEGRGALPLGGARRGCERASSTDPGSRVLIGAILALSG